jgi:hypothetical protein
MPAVQQLLLCILPEGNLAWMGLKFRKIAAHRGTAIAA